MTLLERVRAYDKACAAEREALAVRMLAHDPEANQKHRQAVRTRARVESELYAALDDPAEALKWTLAASVMLRCIETRSHHAIDCPRGKHCKCGIAEALEQAASLGLKVPEDIVP